MSHDAPHPRRLDGTAPEAPPIGPRARMAEEGEKPGFWDKESNATWLFRGLYAVCAVLVIADFVYHRHTEHPWEGLYTFYPLYGFVGITILVLLAIVLRKVVMRPEDYYDAE